MPQQHQTTPSLLGKDEVLGGWIFQGYAIYAQNRAEYGETEVLLAIQADSRRSLVTGETHSSQGHSFAFGLIRRVLLIDNNTNIPMASHKIIQYCLLCIWVCLKFRRKTSLFPWFIILIQNGHEFWLHPISDTSGPPGSPCRMVGRPVTRSTCR